MLTPAQTSTLLHRRAADVLQGEDVIAARAVARVLADLLAAEGYAQAYASTADGIVVYRTGAEPGRVPIRDFREEIHPRALAVLEAAASAEPGSGARRAATTRRLIVEGARGTSSWLRTVALVARELLPDLDVAEQDEIDALEAQAKAARRPSSAPSPSALAERRQARREAQAADSVALVRTWIATLPGGRHSLADVWDAFQVARERSRDRIAQVHPGALALGRTGFYRLAAELAKVTTGHARARFVEVPSYLRERSFLRRRKYAAALLLQRERFAAR
ncbi:hypothetical protein ACIQF8_03145 [Pseudarthrobacter sp. NPDC092184]|uniref:hypothetical protein n=1 Tax=unclassified Pseudarthrobacter TaxID=2647000 RepID=UPI00381793BD